MKTNESNVSENVQNLYKYILENAYIEKPKT